MEAWWSFKERESYPQEAGEELYQERGLSHTAWWGVLKMSVYRKVPVTRAAHSFAESGGKAERQCGLV